MDLPASCGLRRSGVAGLEPATQCRSKPRQAILAGQARKHTGHKRRRSVGGTPGRRRLASEDHQTSEDRRPEDNSQLSTLSFGPRVPLLSPARTPSLGRENALCPYLEPSQNKTLVPIFGAKPERNACAHIWGEASSPMSRETPPSTGLRPRTC